MQGVSMHEGCPVGFDGLRLVEVSHYDDTGAVVTGRVVVASEHAESMKRIFAAMYEARFQVHSLRPVHEFGGSDDRSMEANNTSAFNCRAITGGSSFSQHSHGNAIDVNPLVNPYVSGTTVLPNEGRNYLDRTLEVPGMIRDGDAVVEAFTAEGWKWGGHWTRKQDYQHFSTNGR
jgi:poly-gamma-glutamate synthesis protein (capsule biosynthesis protein)